MRWNRCLWRHGSIDDAVVVAAAVVGIDGGASGKSQCASRCAGKWHCTERTGPGWLYCWCSTASNLPHVHNMQLVMCHRRAGRQLIASSSLAYNCNATAIRPLCDFAIFDSWKSHSRKTVAQKSQSRPSCEHCIARLETRTRGGRLTYRVRQIKVTP